jgi:hypothetical protein
MLIAEKPPAPPAPGLRQSQNPSAQEEARVADAWHKEAQSRAQARKRGALKTIPVEQAFGFKL